MCLVAPIVLPLATVAGLLSLPQESSSSQEAHECIAEWGPVESSVYPMTRGRDGVADHIGRGARTPRKEHSTEDFRAFLPKDLGGVDLEEVWRVDVERALPFLRQLHPGATAVMRHARPPERLVEILKRQGSDPAEWAPRSIEGGYATWVSGTENECTILIRVHMEFELIAEELYLLPAQFEGTLIWDRANDRPKSFHLALPPRNTNYDLYAFGSIDIGYLPLMQVATEGAERAGDEANGARKRLRSSFYASEQIEWRSLADALERAQRNGRRLHVVQLFGTLDDESC